MRSFLYKNRIILLVFVYVIVIFCNLFVAIYAPGASIIIGIISVIGTAGNILFTLIQTIVTIPSITTNTPTVSIKPSQSVTSKQTALRRATWRRLGVTLRRLGVILWQLVLGWRWRSIGTAIIGIVSLALIFTISIYYPLHYFAYQKISCTPYSEWNVLKAFPDMSSEDAINASRYGQECIGISDGRFHLDAPQDARTLGFSDSLNMVQAAQAYRDDNSSIEAYNAWESAKEEGVTIGGVTEKDAEPLIYLNDWNVTSLNTQNYYDIVIVTMLSGDDEAVIMGRNELRGFYIALNEYLSQQAQGMPSIRFLIANVGHVSAYANQIGQQIEKLAQQDDHLIGILGWPISGNDQVIQTIHDLERTGLPIISPTATADQLSQQNIYFFRMAPINELQAEADIQLVETAFQRVHPGVKNIKQQTINVAVLTTNDSPYSLSLSEDFERIVGQHDPNIHIVSTQPYTQNSAEQIQTKIDNLVGQNIDIIYLPGYSEDAQTVMKELKLLIDAKKVSANIKVVGGDGLTYIKDYPYPAYLPKVADGLLYYTSFTSPASSCESHIGQDDFYDHYRETFGICPGNDAILAYEAAQTIMGAIRQMNQQQHVNDIASRIITIRNNLWKTLKEMDKLHPFSFSDGSTLTTVTFQDGERIDPIIRSFCIGTDGKIASL